MFWTSDFTYQAVPSISIDKRTFAIDCDQYLDRYAPVQDWRCKMRVDSVVFGSNSQGLAIAASLRIRERIY